MIVIGIGSNLAAPGFGSPQESAVAAIAELATLGLRIVRRSHWYLSEPVPPSGQPWYVNGVAIVETGLTPAALLTRLLRLEARFGRRRGLRNDARSLDLDLLDYHGLRVRSARLTLPHPRLHRRRFVLAPLAEIAPRWRHPCFGLGATALLRRLPHGQAIRVLSDSAISQR